MSRSSLLYRQYIKYFYGFIVFVINFTSSSMQYNDRSTISICMQVRRLPGTRLGMQCSCNLRSMQSVLGYSSPVSELTIGCLSKIDRGVEISFMTVVALGILAQAS